MTQFLLYMSQTLYYYFLLILLCFAFLFIHIHFSRSFWTLYYYLTIIEWGWVSSE